MGRFNLDTLLSDYRRWAFDRRSLARSTRYVYTTVLKQADRTLSRGRKKRLWRASTDDLYYYLSETTPHPGTRNTRITMLRSFFDFMVEEGHRRDNPADDLKRPRLPRRVPRALSPKDTRKLLDTLSRATPEEKCMVTLMLYDGLRRDEVRCLKWSQIGEDGWLDLKRKGSNEERVFLHPLSVKALANLPKRDLEWVFPSPVNYGQPISTSTIWKMVRGVGESAGLKDLFPHALRHTFATRMLEVGNDVPTVQVSMGHSDPRTTFGYMKVRDPRQIKAKKRLKY